MDGELRILMLEDTPTDAELAERELRKAGINFTAKRVETREAFTRALEDFRPDIVLSDYKLPDFDGMAALQMVRHDYPEVPVVMVTGALTDIQAVELIHAGARDYVLKDRLARLAPAVQRALSMELGVRARKAAEKALRESEAKFRALVESTSDWIWEIDELGVYTYASPQIHELLGYTAGEVIGKTPFDLMPPDEALRVKKIFDAIVEEQKPFRLLENANLNKDGRTVFLESGGSPIFDSLGVFRGYRGIDRDITERKRAELRIEHLDRLLRSIRGVNRLITREKDRDALLQLACKLLNEVGGYPAVWIVRAGDERVPVAQAGDYQAKQFVPWNGHDWSAAIADGICALSVRDGCVTVLLVADSTAYGTLNICLGEHGTFSEEESSLLREVAEDIAFALQAIEVNKQREAAERSLQEMLTRYTTVTESANDAIICLRPDGTIHFWNKMAQRMFGYTADEAIGKPLHPLIVPELYRSQAAEGIRQFSQTGSGPVIGKTLELTALRKDGAEFPVELSISAMYFGGEWQATAIIRDITERHTIEQERRANAEKLGQTLLQTIEAIGATLEARDPYTAGHQRRVAILASAIAADLGMDADRVRGLYLASTIHDLGKIHLPAEILSKPGRLSHIEFELVKAHPQIGYDIIKDVQFPWPIAQMILQHHERLDGAGYPQGLKNGQILPEAKILAVADVVEAMSSHRPYRPGMGIDAALEEIIAHRGVSYDAAVVDSCVALFREKAFVLE